MKARDYCNTLVGKYTVGVGAGALIPLPGLSLAITAAEVKLVMDIARVYGEAFTQTDALKLVTLLGAKNFGTRAIGEAAIMLPLIGSVARLAIFAGGTKAVGDAVITHFETKHPGAEYAIST